MSWRKFIVGDSGNDLFRVKLKFDGARGLMRIFSRPDDDDNLRIMLSTFFSKEFRHREERHGWMTVWERVVRLKEPEFESFITAIRDGGYLPVEVRMLGGKFDFRPQLTECNSDVNFTSFNRRKPVREKHLVKKVEGGETSEIGMYYDVGKEELVLGGQMKYRELFEAVAMRAGKDKLPKPVFTTTQCNKGRFELSVSFDVYTAFLKKLKSLKSFDVQEVKTLGRMMA